jgi:hypothetical protein
MSTPQRIDRREFMVGVAATGLAVTLPVALAVSTPAVGAPAPRAALADWHVDDMWGVYPRPHEAVGFGRPHSDGERLAVVHPADLAFVVA